VRHIRSTQVSSGRTFSSSPTQCRSGSVAPGVQRLAAAVRGADQRHPAARAVAPQRSRGDAAAASGEARPSPRQLARRPTRLSGERTIYSTGRAAFHPRSVPTRQCRARSAVVSSHSARATAVVLDALAAQAAAAGNRVGAPVMAGPPG